jgi:hypothetical protein
VTNSKLYLSPRKSPDARILHHFVVSFRGPRWPPDPSPEGSLASLTPFSIYSKKKILLFKILMKPLYIIEFNIWSSINKIYLYYIFLDYIDRIMGVY